MSLFILLASLSTLTAQASTTELEDLFSRSFYDSSVYVENRCGENIARFVALAETRGIPLANLQVIEIINRGNSSFGLVAGKNVRVGYDMNWGHHVILFDGQKIYDFDFGTEPAPVSPPEYFDRMFKTDRMRAERERCLTDLGNYELRFYPAKNYLEYVSRRAQAVREAHRLKNLPTWGCG